MEVVGDFRALVLTGTRKAIGAQARLGLGTQRVPFVPRGRGRRGGRGHRRPYRGAGPGSRSAAPAPPPPRGRAPLSPAPPHASARRPRRARAYTREPRQHANEVPRGGGPGWGGGGRGWSRVRVPERAPGTCSLLLRSLLRAPTSRPAKRSGLVSADPLLAAPAATVPAPLIGHRTLRARPACGLGHSGLTSRRPTGLWEGEGRGITHFLGMFQKFSYLSGPQHGANLAILEKLPPPPRVDLMLCAYEKGVQGLGL